MKTKVKYRHGVGRVWLETFSPKAQLSSCPVRVDEALALLERSRGVEMEGVSAYSVGRPVA